MHSTLRRPRRRFLARSSVTLVALAGLGALGTLGWAAPASAAPVASKNTLMIGSGSSTTYFLMQSMDTLFNDSPGCAAFDPTGENQQLNFNCLNDPTTLSEGSNQNPYNDISVQETPLGSSTGILQLENQGTNNSTYKCKNGKSCPTSAVSYARSSRALKSSDQTGLNFVGYAKDGVDWVHFTKTPSVSATVSSTVGNLTDAQISGIWNGTINNWYQITHNKADNAPICVYTAQDGSGTLATWDGYTGVTTESVIGTLTPNISAKKNAPMSGGKPLPFVNAGCAYGANASSYGAHHQIFENETRQMLYNGPSDVADAIFFYSVGRYSQQCTVVSNICDPSGYTIAKGEIDGIAATQATIIGTDNPSYTGPLWPVPRYIYNVYSNGSNSAVPAASPAVVNYVSEIGFICKPQTYTAQQGSSTVTKPILDPNTGVSYRTEVANVIRSFGFFPLPFQKDETGGATINHGANLLLPATGYYDAYSYSDPLSTAVPGQQSAQQQANLKDSSPAGYCKVFTTG